MINQGTFFINKKGALNKCEKYSALKNEEWNIEKIYIPPNIICPHQATVK